MTTPLQLQIGIKTDPIQYRYSYPWLFRLLAEEGIRYVQLGTFFEIYQLPDETFRELRRQAEDFGLQIASIFTAHRELGGFFRGDAHWEAVARRNFERLIEIGALVGARSVGSNPGATLRDQMGLKAAGIRCYLENMKHLMRHAHECGVKVLGIEPMSCLAEPPTLPDEMRAMAKELLAWHRENADSTSSIGFCLDVSHGYADPDRQVIWDNMQLLEAALPYTTEVHLKNTDAIFSSTFGFGEDERRRGIVSVEAVRDLLLTHADKLPQRELIGYLEMGGPKLGRDYTDGLLEDALRASLRHVKAAFATPSAEAAPARGGRKVQAISGGNGAGKSVAAERAIRLAPSIMCADICHLEESVRRLEQAGADLLHFDLMDAHFVPNMPLGLEVLRGLRGKTSLPFDVHLMVDNNDFFVERCAEIGAQQISVHAESAPHLDRTLALIRGHGIKAGVALNPATPLAAFDYVLEQLDFVLLMTVNPGFAGQALVPSALRKIADCRRTLDQRGLTIPIEVDGNVSFENIPRMVAAGGAILVAGSSSLFHAGASLGENMRRTREAIALGLGIGKAPSKTFGVTK